MTHRPRLVSVQKSTLRVGSCTLEVFLLPPGELALDLVSLGRLLCLPSDRVLSVVRTHLGEDFKVVRVQPYNVNTLLLPDFGVLLLSLSRSGNRVAKRLLDSLVGLALYQLGCDTFTLDFDRNDRQSWLIAQEDANPELYERFIQWFKLDGCPKAEIEKRLRAIASLFTTEEAALLAEERYDVARSIGLPHQEALKYLRR